MKKELKLTKDQHSRSSRCCCHSIRNWLWRPLVFINETCTRHDDNDNEYKWKVNGVYQLQSIPESLCNGLPGQHLLCQGSCWRWDVWFDWSLVKVPMGPWGQLCNINVFISNTLWLVLSVLTYLLWRKMAKTWWKHFSLGLSPVVWDNFVSGNSRIGSWLKVGALHTDWHTDWRTDKLSYT